MAYVPSLYSHRDMAPAYCDHCEACCAETEEVMTESGHEQWCDDCREEARSFLDWDGGYFQEDGDY